MEDQTLKLRRKQYALSLESVVEHYNGVRVNETLVGKIRSSKMDEITYPNLSELRLSHSIERPKVYDKDNNEIPHSNNNFATWLETIQKEAKDIMNKNKFFEKEEKEYQERMKAKHQEEALKKKREFLEQYGLLPKVPQQLEVLV